MNTIYILKEIQSFYNKNITKMNKKLISQNKRTKSSKYNICVIVTILIAFQFSGYKNFKTFYLKEFNKLKRSLKDIPSYSWFLRIQKSALFLMIAFLKSQQGQKTGVFFIDSTPIKVCNNKRIHNHKVFKGLAQRGHHSMGWFFGFKLHTIINERGELINCYFSKGNKNDIIGLDKMTNDLQGFIFGDKGYISAKHEEKLSKQNLKLITKKRANMKPKPLNQFEKTILYKRPIIETVIGQLKDIFCLENSKLRSVCNLFTLVLSALIAYSFKPHKPSISLEF